jgi:hypothetical protein
MYENFLQAKRSNDNQDLINYSSETYSYIDDVAQINTNIEDEDNFDVYFDDEEEYAANKAEIQPNGSLEKFNIASNTRKEHRNSKPTKVGEFFQEFTIYMEENRSGKMDKYWKSKCKSCPKEIKDKNGTTSNFWNHLRREHPHLIHANSNKSLKIDSNSPISQSEFDDLLLKCLIVKCNMPLSIVENRDFLEFVSRIWPGAVISRETAASAKLPELEQKIKANFVNEIEKTNHISLKIDFWSDKTKKNFLAATAHYISADNCFKNFLLSLKNVTKECFNTQSWLIQVLNEYKIKDKIYTITTNNVRNMTSAFSSSLPGFENISKFGNATENYEYNSDLDDSIKYFESNFSLAVRLPCFAHVLHLVVQDGLAKARTISSVLKKVAASLQQVEMVDLKNVELNGWNGQLSLIKLVLENREREQGMWLSRDEILQLKEFVEIMGPFDEATIKVNKLFDIYICFI